MIKASERTRRFVYFTVLSRGLPSGMLLPCRNADVYAMLMMPHVAGLNRLQRQVRARQEALCLVLGPVTVPRVNTAVSSRAVVDTEVSELLFGT